MQLQCNFRKTQVCVLARMWLGSLMIRIWTFFVLSCGANYTKYSFNPKARTRSFCFFGPRSKHIAHSVRVYTSRLPLDVHFQAGKICSRCHLSHPISQPDGLPSTWFVQQPSVALKCYTGVNSRCVFYCRSCRTENTCQILSQKQTLCIVASTQWRCFLLILCLFCT